MPIVKSTKQEVIQSIQDNLKNYQYFEVWLDYITDVDDAFMKLLIDLLHDKLIILFRRQNLEKIKMTFKKRLVILSLVKQENVFVDLDIIANKKELDYLKMSKGNIATIVSYHNYNLTPTDRTLKGIIEKMKNNNPTIFKIATFCKTENNALRLLQLQQTFKQKKQKHIVLGMGKFGTITRVFGTLWGNEMIFAPQTIADNSAPGQLTKTQLETIFKLLS
ncbi:MAG TPA: type I 3-dehydroquinate dehydratase [Methylomirabilota bacterium]|nr:type I 3-dehydroquinate dehydratase [Methylomirabilota bacterium]